MKKIESEMRLWLLKPIEPWEPWYDKAFGFVVRAETEERARRLVWGIEPYEDNGPGDEGVHVWLDPELTSCEPLELSGEAGIILRDFSAA